MADNTTLNSGTGGDVIRTDDDGTAKWQYVKLAYGADNTQTIVGSISSNPLPVALSATDNAVLDTIDAVLDAINAKLVTGTVIGDVNLGAADNAVLDSIVTNTNRGSSHYRNIDANAEAAIKASAGILNWIHAINMTAAIAYLHLYDAATGDVTPGTTVPDYTFPIPTQGDTNGSGFNLAIDQEFATAITLVVTTTVDGSTGDPGTNGVFINAGYS